MEAGPKQAVAPVPGGSQHHQELDEAALEAGGPVDDGILLARVHVPELCVSKCLQFPKDQLVWDVKQQCLASLPKVSELSFSLSLLSFFPTCLLGVSGSLCNVNDSYLRTTYLSRVPDRVGF